MHILNKKIYAALLVSSLTLSSIPVSEAYNVGSDIYGHWAQKQLETFLQKGYLAGDENGKVFPDSPMTRAQFATIVNKIKGFEKESEKISKYKDVPEGVWYRSEMAKALEAGYMAGTSEDTMSPDSPIKREQAFVIVANLLGADKEQDETLLNIFSDRDLLSDYATKSTAYLVSNGYVRGDNGKLNPDKIMTRSGGVSFLNESFKITKVQDEKEVQEQPLVVNSPKLEIEKDKKKESKKSTSLSKPSRRDVFVEKKETRKDNTSSERREPEKGDSSLEKKDKEIQNSSIVNEKNTKLVDLGWSQYVTVEFKDGYTLDNSKLIVDNVDVTKNFTKVDDKGRIVKWEITSLNPATLKIESKDKVQTLILSQNKNPQSPKVYETTPESFNIMANGSIAVWDYHLTNYDKDGNVRVEPNKTTFKLFGDDSIIAFYSPDSEVDELGKGQVVIMFNYKTQEEKSWFDNISDVDLLAYNENNNTINDNLNYETITTDHHGNTVGQIKIALGQTNFYSNGRYRIKVTSSGKNYLFPIHVVNKVAPTMSLSGNGSNLKNGENVHFNVENMTHGATMPVYRVTLKTPSGEVRELEKIKDYYLIGDLFVLYNDVEGHNNTEVSGEYEITVYSDGFKSMSSVFTVGEAETVRVRRVARSAGIDAISSATNRGGSSSSGGGSTVMNAYLIFDSDLLANAQILTKLGIEHDHANGIATRWEEEMTSWLYVYSKDGKRFYNYSGKTGAFVNMVNDAKKKGKYLSFEEYKKESAASVTLNRPYAAKYVLEDNLLGETQYGGTYIGRPVPKHEIIESVEGTDLKIKYDDITYLKAIEEEGEICINGNYTRPLTKEEYTVNTEEKTLSISKDKLTLGEIEIRIKAPGYKYDEYTVNYEKTKESVTLTVKPGKIKENVSITAEGDNSTGDIWKHIQEVKLTYPSGKQKNVYPHGYESYDEAIGYNISGKNLTLGKDLITETGEYSVYLKANYYGEYTVNFTVNDSSTPEVNNIPEFDNVTCEKNSFYETTYSFTFTPSYNSEIENWINAVNKVTVNGEQIEISTNSTDQKIILKGDSLFIDGSNKIIVSAEGYEDYIVNISKDGEILGEEEPEEPDNNKTIEINNVEFSEKEEGYILKLSHGMNESHIYNWLGDVSKVLVNNSEYDLGNIDIYRSGREITFNDKTAFVEGENKITISVPNYKDYTTTVQVEKISENEHREEVEEVTDKEAPSAKEFVFEDQLFSREYKLSFDLTDKDANNYLKAITSIQINDSDIKKVKSIWNETKAAYSFANDSQFGGLEKFIEFSDVSFSDSSKTYTLKIIAEGYKDFVVTIKGNQIV